MHTCTVLNAPHRSFLPDSPPLRAGTTWRSVALARSGQRSRFVPLRHSARSVYARVGGGGRRSCTRAATHRFGLLQARPSRPPHAPRAAPLPAAPRRTCERVAVARRAALRARRRTPALRAPRAPTLAARARSASDGRCAAHWATMARGQIAHTASPPANRPSGAGTIERERSFGLWTNVRLDGKRLVAQAAHLVASAAWSTHAARVGGNAGAAAGPPLGARGCLTCGAHGSHRTRRWAVRAAQLNGPLRCEISLLSFEVQ